METSGGISKGPSIRDALRRRLSRWIAPAGSRREPAAAVSAEPSPAPFERIGRHIDSPPGAIQVDCTEAEMTAMLARIAANWQRFGETEPHWSVLTNPVFLQANLAAHLDHFHEAGRHDVDRFLAFAARAGRPGPFARALDFGCGVGRLTFALMPHAGEVCGADISAAHLAEARAEADRRGATTARFARLRAIGDLDELGRFDLIISRLVLQHNPPPVMAAIYARLLSLLSPGGMAIVQMPTFIAGQDFDVATYLAGEEVPMEMNALPQPEIFRIIEAAGCRATEVREDDHLGEGLDGLSHVFAVVRPD